MWSYCWVSLYFNNCRRCLSIIFLQPSQSAQPVPGRREGFALPERELLAEHRFLQDELPPAEYELLRRRERLEQLERRQLDMELGHLRRPVADLDPLRLPYDRFDPYSRLDPVLDTPLDVYEERLRLGMELERYFMSQLFSVKYFF